MEAETMSLKEEMKSLKLHAFVHGQAGKVSVSPAPSLISAPSSVAESIAEAQAIAASLRSQGPAWNPNQGADAEADAVAAMVPNQGQVAGNPNQGQVAEADAVAAMAPNPGHFGPDPGQAEAHPTQGLLVCQAPVGPNRGLLGPNRGQVEYNQEHAHEGSQHQVQDAIPNPSWGFSEHRGGGGGRFL